MEEKKKNKNMELEINFLLQKTVLSVIFLCSDLNILMLHFFGFPVSAA